jgi:hypothetical protein
MSEQRSALFVAEFEGRHRTCAAMFDLDPARGVMLARRAWVSLIYYTEIDEALHQWCNRGRSRESFVDEFMHTRPLPPPIVAARFERDGVVLETYDRDELLALRSPAPPVMKELPRIVTPPDSRICAYCGGNGGPFERITYAGAPSGRRAGACRLRGSILQTAGCDTVEAMGTTTKRENEMKRKPY